MEYNLVIWERKKEREMYLRFLFRDLNREVKDKVFCKCIYDDYVVVKNFIDKLNLKSSKLWERFGKFICGNLDRYCFLVKKDERY